jgi:hypothetical protein
MMQRYQVTYLKPKKKGYSQQTAGDFLTIDDAEFWYNYVEKNGALDIKILVK